MASLTVELPESIPVEEARLELAISLYRSARVTQGEAARMAGFTRPTFIELLAARGVPFTNIEVEDIEEEFALMRIVSPFLG